MDKPVNRYLTAAEVADVPSIDAAIFSNGAFAPAAYDGIEVHPCCTWADEAGELSTERAEDQPRGFEAPVTMWSVYLHLVPDPVANIGGVECVADLSNEVAALSLAAALCSQYGIEPGKGSAVEAMQIASRAPRYVIEPQRDAYRGQPEGEDGETHFGPCDDREAETFAVFFYEAGAERGDAIGLDDFPSRSEAVDFINRHRSGLPVREGR